MIGEYRGFEYSQALNEKGAGQQLLFPGVLFCILRVGTAMLGGDSLSQLVIFFVCFFLAV